MRSKLKFTVFFLTALFTLAFNTPEIVIAQASRNKAKLKKRKVQNMDADLEGYPEYYRKRVLAFRKLIRRQKTRRAKINKAVQIINDSKSPYRKDALQFLIDVKAKSAAPAIIKAGENKDLRADAAYALGEIKNKKGIEFLLRCLYDANRNVRGNAILSLRKITKRQFGYDYSAPEEKRNKSALLWESWWVRNEKNFKIHDISDEEAKDAEEKWEKYGKKYIERILNE